MRNIDKYDIQYIGFIPDDKIGNEVPIEIYYKGELIDRLIINDCAPCAMASLKWWLLQEAKGE